MANSINRLTAKGAASISKAGYHADGGGLYLRVTETGAKGWAFIFQWGGKRKEMGLGSLLGVDLAVARELAACARKQVAAGVNPIEARKAQRVDEMQAVERTFGVVAEGFIKAREGVWKGDKHAKGWRLMLRTHARNLCGMDVAAITTDDVLGVLRPLWGTKPETAMRTRARVEQVLDAARAAGLRKGENPARWKGHLAFILPARRQGTNNYPAMPYGHLPAFLRVLRERMSMTRAALEFTLLTATRTNETLGATWREVDLEARVWTIPAERMKAAREHRVPLSDEAVAVLLLRPSNRNPESYVFPGGRLGHLNEEVPLAGASLINLMNRLAPAYTVHGFRSTFSDWAAEETDYSHEMAEVCLAHAVGTQVARAYRRGDMLEKRRQLMQAWGLYVSGEGRPAPIVQ